MIVSLPHSARKLALSLALSVASMSALSSANATSMVVFGDSLSDTGNNQAALIGSFGAAYTATPQSAITSNFFIPGAPYASGNYTNGQVWSDYIAPRIGDASLSVPSLMGGSNNAFGGARTGTTPSQAAAFPYDLSYQVQFYLSATGGAAPADIYVLAGGGNDARDAVTAAAGGGNYVTLAQQYAARVRSMVDTLDAASDGRIIVWNTPNLGATPFAIASEAFSPGAILLSNLVVDTFNAELALALTGSSAEVYDIKGSLSRISASSGITNFTDACVPSLCTNPDSYLFWDAIHPTTAGHLAIANDFQARMLPVPGVAWMVLLGLAALGFMRRKV